MKLLGKQRLFFIRGHDRNLDLWINAWVSEIAHANWKAHQELVFSFPKAHVFDGSIYMFPVGESPYRIIALFNFQKGVAIINEVTTNE